MSAAKRDDLFEAAHECSQKQYPPEHNWQALDHFQITWSFKAWVSHTELNHRLVSNRLARQYTWKGSLIATNLQIRGVRFNRFW